MRRGLIALVLALFGALVPAAARAPKVVRVVGQVVRVEVASVAASPSTSASASPSPAAKRGGGSAWPLALLGAGLVSGFAIVFLKMRHDR